MVALLGVLSHTPRKSYAGFLSASSRILVVVALYPLLATSAWSKPRYHCDLQCWGMERQLLHLRLAFFFSFCYRYADDGDFTALRVREW